MCDDTSYSSGTVPGAQAEGGTASPSSAAPAAQAPSDAAAGGGSPGAGTPSGDSAGGGETAEGVDPSRVKVLDVTDPEVVYNDPILKESVDRWRASLDQPTDQWGNVMAPGYVKADMPDFVPASLISWLMQDLKDNPEVMLAMGAGEAAKLRARLASSAGSKDGDEGAAGESESAEAGGESTAAAEAEAAARGEDASKEGESTGISSSTTVQTDTLAAGPEGAEDGGGSSKEDAAAPGSENVPKLDEEDILKRNSSTR